MDTEALTLTDFLPSSTILEYLHPSSEIGFLFPTVDQAKDGQKDQKDKKERKTNQRGKEALENPTNFASLRALLAALGLLAARNEFNFNWVVVKRP